MRHSALAALALSSTLLAQQPQGDPRGGQAPTFRSGVTYVEVEASVTGKDGRSIDDLSKEDFTLLDGGTPQTIATFTRVDIPVEAAQSARAADPDTPVLADSVSNTSASGRVFA